MGCSSSNTIENSNNEQNKMKDLDKNILPKNNTICYEQSKELKEKWKKDKINLLNYFFEVIQRNLNEDGSPPKLKILYSSKVKQVKDIYSQPDLFIKKKFSFIKQELNINWERGNYGKIKREIEDYFIANPDLVQYDGFDFDNINQVSPYESPDLELNFAKTSTFENVPIEVGKDEIVIVIFFNYKDYRPSQKIKELNNYLIENPSLREKVKIIPVLNETAYSKEDAKNKEEVLNLLGFQLSNTGTFVLREKDDYLKKVLSWENEESSICVIFDKKGVIRKVSMSSEIYSDDINLFLGNELNYQKKQFSDDKKVILQENCFSGLKAISIDSQISFDLWIKKDKIFTNAQNIESVYYHPPHLNCSYTTKLGPSKEELVKSLCNKVSSVCLTFVKPITGKEILQVISKEIMKMKLRNAWVESQKYTIDFNITYLLHRNYYFGKTKETELSLNLFLNDENSLDLQTLIKELDYVRAYPQLPKFGAISFQGEIGKAIPNLLALHDENDQDDVLDLSDLTKPKVIFIVSCQTDDKEKFDIYRNLFWDNIQKFIGADGRYDLHIIYRGDSFDNAIEIQDHEMFKQKIFLWKFSNHESDLRINVDKPFDYLVLFLNKNNQLQYCGDLVDLDLGQSLIKMMHDNPIVFLKKNLKNRENFSDFKDKLLFLAKGLNKHFEDQGFVYKPYIEFKYTHKIEMMESNETNSIYHNFFLKLKIKDVSKPIMEKPDVDFFTKFFKNEYSGTLTIDYIETISINDSVKCSFCPNILNGKVAHYFDQNTITYMCEKCEGSKNNGDTFILYPTNLIYLKYEKPSILKEIIKKNFEDNKDSLNHLDGLENVNSAECSICSTPIQSQKTVWMSLVHLYDNTNPTLPVILCDTLCFPILSRRDSVKDPLKFNEKQRNNMKMNCIDFDNLVFKKVILPSTTMF